MGDGEAKRTGNTLCRRHGRVRWRALFEIEVFRTQQLVLEKFPGEAAGHQGSDNRFPSSAVTGPVQFHPVAQSPVHLVIRSPTVPLPPVYGHADALAMLAA